MVNQYVTMQYCFEITFYCQVRFLLTSAEKIHRILVRFRAPIDGHQVKYKNRAVIEHPEELMLQIFFDVILCFICFICDLISDLFISTCSENKSSCVLNSTSQYDPESLKHGTVVTVTTYLPIINRGMIDLRSTVREGMLGLLYYRSYMIVPFKKVWK